MLHHTAIEQEDTAYSLNCEPLNGKISAGRNQNNQSLKVVTEGEDEEVS
jgi:hypothetical protein